MTKRAKQHQLEDLSRSKYSLAIPKNWVFRHKDKDYGIDAEVEIFDQNDRTTGLVYWIQLKATENNTESRARKVDLSLDSMRYYKSLDIPVMIVRYSAIIDRFYYKWAHEIDLFFAKENAKTIRIVFTEENIWKDYSADQTKVYLNTIKNLKSGNFTLPIPMNLEVIDLSIKNIPRSIFVSLFRQTIRTYSSIVSLQTNSSKSLLHVTLDNNQLTISLQKIRTCTFHSIKDRSQENLVEGIVADVMLALAAILISIGQIEKAASIVFNKNIRPRFLRKHELITSFIPKFLETIYFEDAMDAISELISSESSSAIEIIALISAVSTTNNESNEKQQKIQRLLELFLSKSILIKENSKIGSSHYNLGNHYQNRRLYKKTIYHYLQARKYEKNYLSQSYYYVGLAGTCFHIRKYHFSSIFYKVALEKGADKSIYPLYADALMFSGNYKLAKDIFSEYNLNSETEHSEWILKEICLDYVMNRLGLEKQKRLKEKAFKKSSLLCNNVEIQISDLEEALALDNLCDLAWFNLGIKYNKSGEYESAAFGFIICGLALRIDIESWVNASLCCLSKKVNSVMFVLVVRTAYLFNGEVFLTKLHSELLTRCTDKYLDDLLSFIETILPENSYLKPDSRIRILKENGTFEEIFIS
jgi:tetratricopeptide (TPR) repeat protein